MAVTELLTSNIRAEQALTAEQEGSLPTSDRTKAIELVRSKTLARHRLCVYQLHLCKIGNTFERALRLYAQVSTYNEIGGASRRK